jgi:integrase
MATRRRGPAEGSVYFDSANNRWVASVSLGFSPDGKRRRRTARGRTKQQARDKLRKLHQEIAAGVQLPFAYTVERAVDDWVSSGLDGRSAATVAKYVHVLKPVLERIGRVTLPELTARDVRQALTVLANDRSSATVAIAHNALTRAIRHAQARDLVRRNVSALIGTPKGQEGRPSKALSAEQARELLKIASDLERHRLGAYVTLCLQTGIRTEEARSLSWAQVDLDGQPDADPLVPPSIAVCRSVREPGETITRPSLRMIGLSQSAVNALRRHRDCQREERLKAGDAWQDHDLVFCTRGGTQLDASNIRRQFRGITEAAGLGAGWTPRELRRTFVSLLFASGTPVEEIARLAGHASTRTTEVIYRRELGPVLTRGAEAMDAIFPRTGRPG